LTGCTDELRSASIEWEKYFSIQSKVVCSLDVQCPLDLFPGAVSKKGECINFRFAKFNQGGREHNMLLPPYLL
jgi:hypothetical protein